MMDRKATIYDLARFRKYHCDEMCVRNCNDCEIGSKKNTYNMLCADFINMHTDRANEIILKWCDEHPVKTRQSEFLKLFPDARINSDGVILIDPCQMTTKHLGNKCDANCNECRKRFWLEEIKTND